EPTTSKPGRPRMCTHSSRRLAPPAGPDRVRLDRGALARLDHGRRHRGGQLEQEGRALPVVRFDPDAAAHPADPLLADVQPETGAANPPGHLRVGAVELLEDAL